MRRRGGRRNGRSPGAGASATLVDSVVASGGAIDGRVVAGVCTTLGGWGRLGCVKGL